MVGKGISLLIVFFLIIPFTLANFDYNETGNADSLFQSGTGKFNADNIPSSEFYTTELADDGISQQRQTPLVSDLDQDGVNEIIILDENTFKLYNGKELELMASFSLPFSSTTYSNFIAFDIDGNDNYTELIIHDEKNQELSILQYNGSSFTNETSRNTSIFTGQTPVSLYYGESVIKCLEVEHCVLAWVSESYYGKASSVYVSFFNTTNISVKQIWDNDATATGFWCMPRIRHMAVADMDNDNIDEFVFSALHVATTSAHEDVDIYYGEILSNNSVSLDYQITDTQPSNIFQQATGASCRGSVELAGTGVSMYPATFITSPLIYNLKGTEGDGLETVVAFNIDNNEFNMALYNGCSGDGCTLNQVSLHPDIADTQGDIISNVFLADVFEESGNEDYCVMGYRNDEQDIRLLCASEKDRHVLSDEILFEFDISEKYNISRDENDWNLITHSAQHSQDETVGTKNTHEIVTSYGVFELDYEVITSDCWLPLVVTCSLDLIFENPAGDSVLISVDAEKEGQEDLIALSSTNLWYIDDQLTNAQADIAPLNDAYNPCLDSTWKVNTSFEARVKIIDEEEDDIQGRVILYYGTDNAQDSGWSVLQSTTDSVATARIVSFSQTNESLDFVANKTTASGTIRIMVRDNQEDNQDNPTTKDVSFTVASNGVERGDCTSNEGGTITPDVVVCTTTSECSTGQSCIDGECVQTTVTLTDDASDNSVVSGCMTIANLTGLSCTSLWLVGMLMMTVLIWFVMAEERHLGGGATLGTIAIANVLAIILGARLDILGTGMIVIMVLMGIVILGVFLGKFFTGLHSSES